MIYLDHNATTALDRHVFDCMVPYLRDNFGNPSSYYRLARDARAAVEQARQNVAAEIGSQPEEVAFTAGGTEADNLALKGIAFARRERGNHIVTSAIEHPAILQTCRFLETIGYDVTYLPVDRHGLVAPDGLRAAITDRTILVSIMMKRTSAGVAR